MTRSLLPHSLGHRSPHIIGRQVECTVPNTLAAVFQTLMDKELFMRHDHFIMLASESLKLQDAKKHVPVLGKYFSVGSPKAIIVKLNLTINKNIAFQLL